MPFSFPRPLWLPSSNERSSPFHVVCNNAERLDQLSEFLVIKRSSRDFEGIHRGKRRTREMCLRVWTLC